MVPGETVENELINLERRTTQEVTNNCTADTESTVAMTCDWQVNHSRRNRRTNVVVGDDIQKLRYLVQLIPSMPSIQIAT